MASLFRRRWRVSPGWMALPLLPLLAACANSGAYPSLSRRPVERMEAGGQAPGCDCPPAKRPPEGCETTRITGSAPVVAPAVPAGGPDSAAGAETGSGVAALVASARTAHARFEAGRAAAISAVAAGAGTTPAGPAWLRANQALVELDRARADSGAALATLDRIALDDRLAHAVDDPDDTADRPGAQAIRDGVAMVSGWVAAEDAVLGRLKRQFVGESK